jgi:hypothetical protein
LRRRGTNQHSDGAAELHAHAFGCRAHLLVIANVGADPESGPAAMFNLQVTKIEFGFATRQQSYAGALLRKPDGQAFSNAASRAGNEHRHSLHGMYLLNTDLVGNYKSYPATKNLDRAERLANLFALLRSVARLPP